MTLSGVSASGPDLLRLLTIPVFAWVAILDIRTRRVPSAAWIPLGALGAGLLVWDGWIAYQADVVAWQEFLIPAALSLGFVVPLAYLFWWFGGFGGADAKALLVLALLFPVVPSYAIGGLSFPLAGGDELLPFSLSILANGVLVGLAIPVALAIRNALAGRVTGVMALGWPVSTDRIPETHGRLLQTTEGVSLGGLDLDALRMYLRWRGLTLDDVREDPDRYRDPSSLPDVPNPPTDGAVTVANPVADGGKHEEATAGDETAANDSASGDGDESTASESDDESTASEAAGESDGEFDDPWGADAFLESIEGTAYGTSAADLRDGLDVLTQEETVWISPGTPFLVPLFAGLVLALGYGDLLVTLVM